MRSEKCNIYVHEFVENSGHCGELVGGMKRGLVDLVGATCTVGSAVFMVISGHCDDFMGGKSDGINLGGASRLKIYSSAW